MQTGPPGAEQNCGTLPVRGQVDRHHITGHQPELVAHEVGRLGCPVRRGDGGEFGALAGRVVVVGDQRLRAVAGQRRVQRGIGESGQFTHSGPVPPAVIAGAGAGVVASVLWLSC